MIDEVTVHTFKMEDTGPWEETNQEDTDSRKSIVVENCIDQHYDYLKNPSGFVSYNRRWYLLSTVMVINFTNALIWIMFAPVTDITSQRYDISLTNVNYLSLVFLIASVPSGFFASWMLDTLGLRASIICAAWLNLIGAGLRNTTVYSFIPHDYKFPLLLTGQTIAALGQTFIMFTPAKTAGLWFKDDQRAIATTLASMANPVGIMVANVLSPALVKSASEMGTMLWFCTGWSILGVLMSMLGIHSSLPPTPPSPSAAAQSEPFFIGIKKLKNNKNFWYLTIAMGGGLALFTSFSTFLEQILCPRNYSNKFAGLCGALMIAFGVVGAVVAGVICDKTKKFSEITKIGFCVSNLFGIGMVQAARYRDQEILVAAMAGLFGGFGFAVYPISLELAVEVTYPVAEATSTGLIFISGQIQGIIMMLVAQYTTQNLSAHEAALPQACPKDGEFDPQDWTYPNIGANVLGLFYCVVIALLFKPQYRRMTIENMMKGVPPIETNGVAEKIPERTNETEGRAFPN